MIYFDNAATSFPKPDSVAREVYNAINSLGNGGRGCYEISLAASRTIYNTRKKVANLFNIDDPLNVAFTSNATEALNMAILGTISQNDHVITTIMEHNSVLRPIYKTNCSISFIGLNDKLQLDYSSIENEIKPNTKAIITTHASNLTGYIVDIKKIGELCKRHNILFIVDASQTAGIIDIDVYYNNIDILCLSGHKGLMGCQGTGVIYVKKGVSINPLKVGGSGSNSFSKNHPTIMPDILEAGTANSHSIAGLSAGIDYIMEIGINEIYKKEMSLLNKFYNGIKDINGIKIYGDNTKNKIANIAFNLFDFDSSLICEELSYKYNIAVRGGSHCAPLIHEAIGTTNQGAIRFSFSYFNSENEIDFAVSSIKKIIA